MLAPEIMVAFPAPVSTLAIRAVGISRMLPPRAIRLVVRSSVELPGMVHDHDLGGQVVDSPDFAPAASRVLWQGEWGEQETPLTTMGIRVLPWALPMESLASVVDRVEVNAVVVAGPKRMATDFVAAIPMAAVMGKQRAR